MRRTLITLTAAAALIVVGLPACGGDETATSTDSGGAADAPTPEELEKQMEEIEKLTTQPGGPQGGPNPDAPAPGSEEQVDKLFEQQQRQLEQLQQDPVP